MGTSETESPALSIPESATERHRLSNLWRPTDPPTQKALWPQCYQPTITDDSEFQRSAHQTLLRTIAVGGSLKIRQTAPEVHEKFAAGKFTVHQTAGDFNGVWTDLALEQTYNREGKTSLFKGITQLESAREKYIKALLFMTSVSESVKQMAHMTSSQSDHREKLRKDDMEAVLQIKRTVEEKMQNPFHPSLATDKLMNISTGQILAATTLVDAKRLGLKTMNAATTTNADKIVQPKMETFATHLKKIQKKIDTVKEVIREESAVTKALCFAQNLSDEARTEAFSYEWLEYPPPLFEPEKNGYSMRKGCKFTYLSTLQAEVADSWEPLKELPPSAADAVYVVDAMAFIQRFNTLGSSTFGQLQERYREKLLNMKPRHCTEVHFVGDQYDFWLKSLKGDERQRRESNINLPEYVPADSIKIPDWKTLLLNPCNKTNMMSYLASRWSQEASWPAGFCLVLGVNAQATRVTQTEHTDVDELYCPNHEEADTRIFAHIASCDANNVLVIQATDTDIIVLAMYHFPRLPNVVELWVYLNDPACDRFVVGLPLAVVLRHFTKSSSDVLQNVDKPKLALTCLFWPLSDLVEVAHMHYIKTKAMYMCWRL
ncbi:hypothetical protein GQR58_004678 [Nymphon striatum]|nr:hypothetical protein GQR58_004678 [Nymphon striatum]